MIYDYVTKKIPNGLTKLEIARYIYIELGNILYFTTKNEHTTKNFYSTINQKIDVKTFSDNETNCNYWSQLYSSLLSSFGIKNRIVNFLHKFVVFYLDDIRWVADATFGFYPDLARIHYGDMTSLFGPAANKDTDADSNVILLDNLSMDQIYCIDKKMGYSDKVDKMSDFINLLNSIRDNKGSIHEKIDCGDNEVVCKLEFLFKHIGKLSFGYNEAKYYVYKREQDILEPNELATVKSVELARVAGNEVDRLQCIYTRGKNGYKYYLVCPTLSIKSITFEQLCSLKQYGFNICGGCLPVNNTLSGLEYSDNSMDCYNFSQKEKTKII